MIVLVHYIKTQSAENQVFDPFHILGPEPGAPDSEIQKAYRKLSVLYHPDKNPDPEANKCFVEKIVQTYQALTDQVSREYYEKYGHPDGRQVGKIYRQLCHAPDVVHLLLLYEAFSRSQSQVMDVFIKAAESTEIPVRKLTMSPFRSFLC